jgi:hypothetical protein
MSNKNELNVMAVRDGDLGNTEKAITVPDLCANRIEN